MPRRVNLGGMAAYKLVEADHIALLLLSGLPGDHDMGRPAGFFLVPVAAYVLAVATEALWAAGAGLSWSAGMARIAGDTMNSY